MAVVFTCGCGQQLQAVEEMVGQRVPCSACGAEVRVPGTAPPSVRSGWAVGSLALGLSSLGVPVLLGALLAFTVGFGQAAVAGSCLPIVLGVPAVVLGIVGLVRVSGSRGQQTGKGWAISGVVLGVLAVVAGVVFALGSMVSLATRKSRDSANAIASANNLRTIGLAFHCYHDAVGHLPPVEENGLSWRVHLLPFLEESALYEQFHLNEPWDSPHNIKLVERMPRIYRSPRLEAQGDGLTYYRALTGPGTVFGWPKPLNLGAIGNMDGTANSWLVVEAGDPVPWTKPDELVYTPDKPLPAFGGPQRVDFYALYVDGHVARIRQGTSEKTIRALITVDGKDFPGPDAP